MERQSDAIVVGGGLAGLAAAAYLARAGRRVRCSRRRRSWAAARDAGAGRASSSTWARTRSYAAGQARAVLRELEVAVHGPTARRRAARSSATGDAIEPLPAGALGLLSSRLLTVGAKWELARLLGSDAPADRPRRRTACRSPTGCAGDVRHEPVAERSCARSSASRRSRTSPAA
jgi:glycine/D-amino acid oxidase-like deaminating enzyme